MTEPSLYLASRSPRRRELLARLGVRFSVVAADVDESPRPGEGPAQLVRRLAADKARVAAASFPASAGRLVVLAADTVVVQEGAVYGKPADRTAALEQLERLSGREHQVLTAVAVLSAEPPRPGRIEARMSRTRVWMRVLDRAEREAYWETGEAADKAGSYAIQGIAGRFVTRVEGSYSAVVGLPLDLTESLLARTGIELPVATRDDTGGGRAPTTRDRAPPRPGPGPARGGG